MNLFDNYRSTSYEIIGWSAERIQEGMNTSAKYADKKYNGLVLTREGKREYIDDHADFTTIAPPSWDPHGEGEDVWQALDGEDFLLIEITGFVGFGTDDCSGPISWEIQQMGIEDTFDSHWKAIAEMFWNYFDAFPDHRFVSLPTLWRYRTFNHIGEYGGEGDWDVEIDLMGIFDMYKVGYLFDTIKIIPETKGEKNAN